MKTPVVSEMISASVIIYELNVLFEGWACVCACHANLSNLMSDSVRPPIRIITSVRMLWTECFRGKKYITTIAELSRSGASVGLSDSGTRNVFGIVKRPVKKGTY